MDDREPLSSLEAQLAEALHPPRQMSSDASADYVETNEARREATEADDSSIADVGVGRSPRVLARRRFSISHKFVNAQREQLLRELGGWPLAILPKGRQLTQVDDDQLRQYLGYLWDWAAQPDQNSINPPIGLLDFIGYLYTASEGEDVPS